MHIPDNATNKDLEGILLLLAKRSENNTCMDCGAAGPRWAAVNWGIFVCIRCSGIHRNLGTHISKVKSVNLDKWSVDEVRWMERMGNENAKVVLEARSKYQPEETTPTPEMISIIKAKYERLEMASKSKKPPTFKSWLKREEKRRQNPEAARSEKKKKKKKAAPEPSDSSDDINESDLSSPASPSKGMFGDVTGDPATVTKRRNELLSLFS